MKKCKVLRPNTCGANVGEVIELTDNQIRANANKVEVLPEDVKPKAAVTPKAKSKPKPDDRASS